MALPVEGMLVAGLAVLLGAFLVGLAALSKLPAKRAAALVGGLLVVSGGVFLLGIVEIPDLTVPKATGLYAVSFLATSDTDRTEAGESITGDGHTITFIMSDANMDGLGDVNLDMRVTNQNIGAPDAVWPFEADLTYVGFTQVSSAGAQQPIVNMTDFNTRFAISWSFTDVGEPTGAQEGQKFVSRDFMTGKSDSLNADLEMLPAAMDDLAAGAQARLEFLVGGVLMSCILQESA